MVSNNLQKPNVVGDRCWWTLRSHRRFSFSFATLAIGERWHRWHLSREVGLLRWFRAVNVNRNGDVWRVNANSVSNEIEWNVDNRFFSRNSQSSPLVHLVGWGSLLSRFFFISPLLQPKSICPIFSSITDIWAYFSMLIAFISQAVCIRNLRISKVDITKANSSILGLIGK